MGSDESRGPSDYQPNVLPLAQTGLPPLPPSTNTPPPTPPPPKTTLCHYYTHPQEITQNRAQELCERRDKSPGLPAFFFFTLVGHAFHFIVVGDRDFWKFVYIKFCTGGLEFANLSHLTYNVFYGKQNVEQASLFPPPQIEITLQTGADWLWQRWTETFDTDCFSSFLYLIIIFNFYI